VKWINAGEQLPPVFQDVLCYSDKWISFKVGHIISKPDSAIGTVWRINGLCGNVDYMPDRKPTHWMKLPKKPEKKIEDE
jgi:hypothetical protein